MNLADEADGNRQVGLARQAVLHRAHVVDHFVHVARTAFAEDVGFGGEKILEGTLRPLDLAREYGLLANVHVDEQVRIGQGLYRAIQAAECTVGFREETLQIASDPHGGGLAAVGQG